jgi:hypothetical protein
MDAHFTIRKWYLDCISEAGDTVIVYAAELSWRGLRTHYSSLLATQNDAITCRTAMADCAPAETDTDAVSAKAPKLGLAGSWKRSAASVKRSLLETPEGVVAWDCIQPKADARVTIAGIGEFSGLGYVECLTMTIPPWRLPMSQLRWGRFLSHEDSLVWIDWQGTYSTRFSVHNGTVLAASQITDQEIVFDRHALTLDRGLTLRSGLLGDTVLPSAPMLRNLLPGSLFKIEEHKWRSRGNMTSPEQASRFGWAIHEVVQWNQ